MHQVYNKNNHMLSIMRTKGIFNIFHLKTQCPLDLSSICYRIDKLSKVIKSKLKGCIL